MPKIFVVEDDEALRNELIHLLESQGFVCDTSTEYLDIIRHITACNPDCVVLDLKLPETSGHDICRSLRAVSSVPVIMLTSSDSEFDELMGMNLGADDFVTKPYNPAILLARIQSVLRRAQGQTTPSKLVHRGVTLDLAKSEISYEGSFAELTRNELKIIALLMKSRDTIISRTEIMNELWQSDEFIDDNTLTVNINRLRKSLADIGVHEFLITRRGQGYLV